MNLAGVMSVDGEMSAVTRGDGTLAGTLARATTV